ncbi:hypothetical protein H4582DRAFT_120679 [Lactarius indigo]|nr:hypothetical protein H4582DRAFT_120679 [Lactarius indigo]
MCVKKFQDPWCQWSVQESQGFAFCRTDTSMFRPVNVWTNGDTMRSRDNVIRVWSTRRHASHNKHHFQPLHRKTMRISGRNSGRFELHANVGCFRCLLACTSPLMGTFLVTLLWAERREDPWVPYLCGDIGQKSARRWMIRPGHLRGLISLILVTFLGCVHAHTAPSCRLGRHGRS